MLAPGSTEGGKGLAQTHVVSEGFVPDLLIPTFDNMLFLPTLN